MKKINLLLTILAVIIFSACSKKLKPSQVTKDFYTTRTDSLVAVIEQQTATSLTDSAGVAIPAEWVGTVNFNLRKPNYVIIHYTAQDSVAQTIRTFSLVKPQVSAHYVISGNGKIYHMLNDYMRAWHAGVSKWGNVTDMNSSSIGIELDNKGNVPFTEAQTKSLITLLAYLKRTYNIPQANFIGHGDIAPGRKPDPGILFPWKRLAEKGFGFWQDPVITEVAPADFNAEIALKLIGYDVSNLPAAISAFKRHFVQIEDSPVLTPCDLDVLFNVYRKY
ncbi:N-acetylmuramoyl-L-alanine amidase [Mucilaginibacter pallidiroseus]|uniref:N-acetylmuramoyl-L-alanine amidase n=1 Tax=Mucilaginibacter pallidiroseus TaxID=2599295 RepID=A0A563UE81_9SPHI|nr:N-acetylmuramoyl-L-alanine amidase [Mucilaginibacter pallidiroseus]TWR29677.1 N-acetylmuramoyl-L-alanine amidase [Mucilaginibacter pallidiroseus]